MSSREPSIDRIERRLPEFRKSRQIDYVKRIVSAWLGLAALPITSVVMPLSAQNSVVPPDPSPHHSDKS